MGLQQELGFIEPISGSGHEAIMSIVLTGVMLAKEGDRLFRPFGLTDSQFQTCSCCSSINPRPVR